MIDIGQWFPPTVQRGTNDLFLHSAFSSHCIISHGISIQDINYVIGNVSFKSTSFCTISDKYLQDFAKAILIISEWVNLIMIENVKL